MTQFRKIGVLTSGGDAPGMNACIKAVVNKASELGMETVGIQGGYASLISGDLSVLSPDRVYNIASKSGTILYTSRCPEFATAEGMSKAVETCRKNGIDALVCIGGDGTYRGATDIANHGIPAIAVPATIDNDITASEYTIGLDSAVNETVHIVDALLETAESHNRIMILEAMGRNCGHISLYTGIATGAIATFSPEYPLNEEKVLEKIISARKGGKRSMAIIVAEGMPMKDGLPYGEYLEKKLNGMGLESRFMRPEHVVRGAQPTMRDRAFANEVGSKAVELLVEGKSDLALCMIDGKISTVDINVSLIADRKYKNKLKPGDLDRFNAEQLALIDELVSRKAELTQNLAKLANSTSF